MQNADTSYLGAVQIGTPYVKLASPIHFWAHLIQTFKKQPSIIQCRLGHGFFRLVGDR